MEHITESSKLIEEMLEVEKNAGRILEETREKANQMVLQARSKERRLIEKTREDLQKERDALERGLHAEGEEEAARIIATRDKAVQRIKEKAGQERDQALRELREILFGDLQC